MVVVLLGLVLLSAGGMLPRPYTIGLVGGSAMVAGVGWLDDHRPISAFRRLAVHFVAGAWMLFWLGGMPDLELGQVGLHLGWIGTLLGLFGLVWHVNLYNFMDGIDGLAGGEAVTVGAVGGVLLWFSGATGLALTALLVAGGGAGFLIWNWQPAKIFMGDVGSGFMGFIFAGIAIASENAGAVPVLIWVLWLGVFVFDSTVTLFRRMLRGERWSAAHRRHAYQRAVQSGLTHAQVTGRILAINGVLVVLGTVAWVRPTWMLACLIVSAAVLLGAYVWVERRRPMFA